MKTPRIMDELGELAVIMSQSGNRETEKLLDEAINKLDKYLRLKEDYKSLEQKYNCLRDALLKQNEHSANSFEQTPQYEDFEDFY